MKYLKCTCMLGVPDEDYQEWSEHSDFTFTLARAFHNPEKNMYLINHDYELHEEKSVKRLKYSFISKCGGV